MQIGGCARTAHESNVFVALGLAVSEKQIPKLLKTLETKIVDGANREDSGSLQAGGHRFDPGHVHHISNQLRLGVLLHWLICDVVCDITPVCGSAGQICERSSLRL